MRCPYCHDTRDRVVDSRTSRENRAVRRRRECLNCGRRFTTYEYVEERPLQVLKRGHSVETYDRAKLVRSLKLACAKRPIAAAEIEAMTDTVEDELAKLGRDEIESRVIGEVAMEVLQRHDHVAYVRYASVYRNFRDINQFVEELQDLSARRARAALNKSQVELPLESV
jgi:transcriptional repressor NrdR